MRLSLQILMTGRVLERTAQRVFRRHGLTPAYFNVLNLLADRPDGMRASDLAVALVVDPSNVTGLLRRMTRDGLLEEVAREEDRRQRVVRPSPKGGRAWKKAVPSYESCLETLEKTIEAGDRQITDAALRRIAEGAALLPE